MAWNEQEIARALAVQVFHRRALVMVPNCMWTGNECDLLVVRNDLRLIDVEVKISRSDLKADAKKDKWVDVKAYTETGHWIPPALREYKKLHWPRKIWKHYYALPEAVWKDGLHECIPEASGVLFMRDKKDGTVGVHVHRQAKPCKDAERLTPEQVMDIARVLTVRYWDRYAKLRGGYLTA